MTRRPFIIRDGSFLRLFGCPCNRENAFFRMAPLIGGISGHGLHGSHGVEAKMVPPDPNTVGGGVIADGFGSPGGAVPGGNQTDCTLSLVVSAAAEEPYVLWYARSAVCMSLSTCVKIGSSLPLALLAMLDVFAERISSVVSLPSPLESSEAIMPLLLSSPLSSTLLSSLALDCCICSMIETMSAAIFCVTLALSLPPLAVDFVEVVDVELPLAAASSSAETMPSPFLSRLEIYVDVLLPREETLVT
jgi:hypothetical protein